MRVLFANRKSGQIEYGIIYGGVILSMLGAVRLLPVLSFAPQCLFRKLTGLPCPTCGATRSVVHLAHGDISLAFMMNPLAAAGILIAIFFFFYSIITLLFELPRFRVLLRESESKAIRWGSVALLLAQWLYLLMRLS
jgi:hypothetical protein